MSESWSDLVAVEYLAEHGYAPAGSRAFTIGEYVTSDPGAGIRNYNMSNSPLNYSHIDYDFVGLQVHASGEVWSATNVDIRQALIGRYGAGNAALQKSCANGETPVTSCPGNRRWAQLMFDSYLLLAVSGVSMVDSRDALLAADMIRFGGANQDLLWNAFATRGLGEGASSNGPGDPNPVPSFVSPFATEATVTFAPVDETGQAVSGAQLFVGDYQARARAVADTDPATTLGNTVQVVPGTYELLATAAGRGHVPGGTCRLHRRLCSHIGRRDAHEPGVERGWRGGERRRYQPGPDRRRQRGHQLGLARQPGRGQAGDRGSGGRRPPGGPCPGERRCSGRR